ncbi:glucokinase [Gracilibacillus halotolerans]|uniref:Glucokinase n=1 Tax=Gracilibacillus halotolerans TaxID=74386 RepID=A0A841RLE6_9BACI|nr:ROK family glucokinase [Gracilibacillus halotolerans]MBB6511784.1 glucokinase [Gracilibacillus halotolerans]
MTNRFVIGVDIGGTTVKNALFRPDGELIDKWEIPTRKTDNGSHIPADIWTSIEAKMKTNNLERNTCLGIGAGAPGFIEPETGKVAIGVNIGWKDFHLKKQLEELSGLPVFLDNDANIAALGETWKGAGKDASNILAVTLGTGVGGGIIVNRHIVSGANGTAAEIGHITVEDEGAPCNCGRKGCLETVASATGIVRQANELLAQGKAPLLREVKEELGKITTKEIFEVALKGDQDIQKMLDHVLDVLGFSLSNLAIALNPSKIIIGGGVSKAGDQILTPLKQAFKKYTLPRTEEICEIVIAKLGNDAGVYGGAYLVLQSVE